MPDDAKEYGRAGIVHGEEPKSEESRKQKKGLSHLKNATPQSN